MKIVLINHSFQKNYYSRRWRLFAKDHPDVDVTLLTPDIYKWYNNKAYTYDGGEEFKATEVNENNFHIKTFSLKYRHSWLSDDYKSLLQEIKPNVIYHIGTHTQLSLVQIGRIARKYLPASDLILFTMRGPLQSNSSSQCHSSIMQWLKSTYFSCYEKIITKYVRGNYDAVFCHYPDGLNYLRHVGFKQPIYMQTQVGVNPEWFYPNEEWRKEIREKYNISNDTYVFGSASRFTPDKGLDDIVEAMPVEGDWKFLMMGKGGETDMQRIRNAISKKGLENKIILTGYIDNYEIAKYWNAIDCAIHVPRTTSHWVETFSLSVVQAMITGKPIIGNSSGSVPYQIGYEDMIVNEGDIHALHEKILWILKHPQEQAEIGRNMRERAMSCFSIKHLNDLFYKTLVEDVLPGNYDERKSDMCSAET